MGLINRDAILSALDLVVEDVDVPQWGGTVRVCVMSGAVRDEFRTALSGEGGTLVGKFEATLLACTVVDKTGDRLFTLDDVPALMGKSGPALDLVAGVAMRLNGLGEKAEKDAVKN